MTEFEIGFSKDNIAGGIRQSFEVLYNTSRLSSHDGELVAAADGLYFFYTNNVEKTVKKPWCISYGEIAHWEKSGLAGYLITLKDGNVLRFSNVFRKTRNAISELLEQMAR